MNEELKNYGKTIRKKHCFGWVPKYHEIFETNITEAAFIAVTTKVVEELEWEIIYIDDGVIEAKRYNKYKEMHFMPQR